MIHEMRTASFQRVRDVCISTCERLVRSGITQDDRYLGASYVLSALTLVSPRARAALPWLYQSVAAGSPTMAAGVGVVYITAPPTAPTSSQAQTQHQTRASGTVSQQQDQEQQQQHIAETYATYTTYNNILNTYLINNVINNTSAANIYNDEIDDTILYNILTAMNTTNSIFRTTNINNNNNNINATENGYSDSENDNELE
jgi:hypothetical protein